MTVPVPPLVQDPAADLAAWRAGDPDLVVRAAEGAVRSWCGWHIAPEITETITVDGSGAVTLLLPSAYVTDIEALSEDGVARDWPTDYDWSQAGVLYRSTPWTANKRAVQLTLTHGHTLIPSEVVGIVYAIADAASKPGGVASETTGPFSITLSSDGRAGTVGLSEIELAVLERYQAKR